MIHPQLIQTAVGLHEAAFRFGPMHTVAAPGRVNLMGEHVDYNGGTVLPMAIDRHTVLAASRSRDALFRLTSVEFGEAVWSDHGPDQDVAQWARYVKAVAQALRGRGLKVPPFQASVASNLPIGAGLSSSAALTVATATLCEVFSGRTLEAMEKARLCQDAEQVVGVPCGLMDPAAIVFGRRGCAVHIDCRNEQVAHYPVWADAMQLWVFDSGVRRTLAAGQYARRRADCETAAAALGVMALCDASPADLDAQRETLGAVPFRRARHVISETARSNQAMAAVRDGNWVEFGRLMNATHQSLRDDFEVSGPEIERLVDLLDQAPADAVLGRRLTGAGFGGCVIALLRTAGAEKLATSVADRYREGRGPAGCAFAVRAVDGAGPVETV